MRCKGCHSTTKTLYLDPRNNPIETEPCICDYCYISAVDEQMKNLGSIPAAMLKSSIENKKMRGRSIKL